MRIEFIRIIAWVLFLFPSLLVVQPANAATPTIANGEIKTGTITGAGSESYTISVPAGGGSFVVSAGETGSHTKGFVPEIDLVAPGGNAGAGLGKPYFTNIEQDNAAEGKWTVKVSRADGGQSGGGYALKLIQIPGATGTALTGDSSGSIVRGGIDVWTFTGTAGHTATLTLARTGGKGFYPKISVFTPAGAAAGGVTCSDSCAQDFAITAAGTWTVLVSKFDGNDETGTYTLSISGQ